MLICLTRHTKPDRHRNFGNWKLVIVFPIHSYSYKFKLICLGTQVGWVGGGGGGGPTNDWKEMEHKVSML